MWVVPIILALCYLFPILDFCMVQMENVEYMKKYGFTQEQIDFWFSYPTWAVLGWGVGVFASWLGAILLLCKRGLATPVTLLGLLAYVVAMIRQYGFTNFRELHTEPTFVIANVIIFVVLLAQLLYARAMARRGVLS